MCAYALVIGMFRNVDHAGESGSSDITTVSRPDGTWIDDS